MIYNLKIENKEAVVKMFQKFGKEAVETFKATTKFRAQEISLNAKNNARALGVWDNGDLVRGISYASDIETKGLNWVVFANERYSAYHEFGTGKMVQIPDGWGELAMQFKGKGIREVNIMPRPYLYPAFKEGSKFYINDLRDDIKFLTDKYSK